MTDAPVTTDANDPETVEAFAERLGLKLDAEKTSAFPPLLNAEPWSKRFRCKACHHHIDPVKKTGLKLDARSHFYRCATCGSAQVNTADDAARTVYRVTVTAPNGGTHSTDYTMGSAYLLGDGPTLADVLDAWAGDANSYRCARDADDFIREFGYLDAPGDALANVRRGEADYLACADTFRALTDLLGMREAGHLLDEVERL